jgi:hypothetical protein
MIRQIIYRWQQAVSLYSHKKFASRLEAGGSNFHGRLISVFAFQSKSRASRHLTCKIKKKR